MTSFSNIAYNPETKHLETGKIFNYSEPFQSSSESFVLDYTVNQIQRRDYGFFGTQINNKDDLEGIVGYQFEYLSRKFMAKQYFEDQPACGTDRQVPDLKNGVTGCSSIEINLNMQHNVRITNSVMTYGYFILYLGSSLTIVIKMYDTIKIMLENSFRNYIGRKVQESDSFRHLKSKQNENEDLISNGKLV